MERNSSLQVEESAISLWNWTVTKHTGAVINDEQRAKLRFVACRLICLCEGSDSPEGTIRRQILMSMKTGKGWIDIGKAGLADGFLENAMSSIEKLYAKLRNGSEGEADIQVHRADVEKSLFKVLSYQAESAVAQGDFQKAVMCVQRCKDMLMKLPKETCYLSILCYNFGVETYEWKRYEQSSFWLSQSYDIGKMDMKYSVGKEMQAKVLRLLATSYFEWDCTLYLDKALKAINLANQENLQPAGFFLKVKILLKSGASDEDINSALAEFMHLEISLDFCLNTAKLLLEHGRESVGFDFLRSVPERFESSPDLGKITLLHIEFLLQNKKELLAKQKIEEVIIGHYTGKQLLPEALNQLHIILWDRAAKYYEEKSYSEALHWYNYSVSFYTPGQIDQNLAKLQRNMASCYLHLKQVDKAKEAVKQAERCDPNSIFTKFSVYKIAVMENDTDKAVEAVIEMGKLAEKPSEHEDKLRVDKNTGSNLLSLAAQIALENDQQIVAIKALEYLAEHLQDCRQLFTALKCLVRLMLSKVMAENAEKRDEDVNSILNSLNLAHKKLVESFTEEKFTGDMRILEAHWFRKVGDFAKDPTDTLLLLYEFEARSKLNDPTLHNLMESVWEQPQIEIKTLEIIASLAMEAPARYPVLCKKALKSALNLHRKQAVIDAEKFSKCLHSLINISLPTGLTDLETCVLQEVWDYFEDALSVVSSTDAYPEMEILWLMTRAWNTGIFQYTVGKYKEAEQWCGLGMRFLNHLGSLKKSYEGHMFGLYSEVLDKLDRAKGFIPNEE
ncbi:PREDICTED: testis-expressed sequence 11 protein [Sturnus vulgaris]|uniref:testis-expressed sequence 11 protein n=1 Tax=Sturnus vulgaris TaxID=9172 RepID=UPI00071A1B14|nr:PREDICTED: testis-expressed sequence 11 protein [Sturnus vulgaris]